VVEIIGFAGEDHELDLMEFIFRCAPALGTMSVTFSEHLSSEMVRAYLERRNFIGTMQEFHRN
jgi:hypothetical protein